MKSILSLLFPLLIVGCVPEQSGQFRVVTVHDGDTVTVLDGAKVQHKIRLHGIDAPELHQAFGARAKKALADKVFGRDVTVRVTVRDQYGREVGDIYIGERWVNLEMVAEGLAWRYSAFSRSQRLAEAEQKARADKLGLWGEANPVPPWQYRKAEREMR